MPRFAEKSKEGEANHSLLRVGRGEHRYLKTRVLVTEGVVSFKTHGEKHG